MAAPARKARNLKGNARAGVRAGRADPKANKLAAAQAASKEALQQQTATDEILQVISSSPRDLKPVFDAILSSATRLCAAHLGILNLWDGSAFRTVAQLGAKGEFAKWLFARGTYRPEKFSALMRMVREKRPIYVDDLRAAPAYKKRGVHAAKLVELGGVRSYVLVPLLKERKVTGGISIYRPEVRPFTPRQVAILSSFASQAVIAIENVRLFNETKEALEQQTATSDILRVIAASPADV